MNKSPEQMDKELASQLQKAAAQALGEVAVKFGLEFKSKAASYSNDSCTVHGSFMLRSINGVERDRALFAQHCSMFDLAPEDFGARVTLSGETWELCGLELRRVKYPLRLRRVPDGKIALYTGQLVPRIKEARRPAAQPPASSPNG
jgi:hypothetical protein